MRYSLLLFLLITTKLFAQEVDVRIPGNIPKIKQPKSLDCWITVTTMMKSWRDNTTYAIEEVAEQIGDPWKLFYETNAGLSFDDQDKYIESIGMHSEAPANYMLEAYIDFLNEHGPLWITTGDGFSAHARLLIGIKGDATYEGTDFIFIDPASGTEVTQNALEFVLEFEEEAKVANEDNWERLRIQIHHY